MPFVRVQFRRGTASQWTTANPILADGEMAIETDTHQFKIGNGVTSWTSLPYGGLVGPQGSLGNNINQDISFNSKISVAYDSSFNSNLFIGRDLSVNRYLRVGADASLNANLFVLRDVSMGANLTVSNKVGIGKVAGSTYSLDVAGNVNLTGNLYLGGTAFNSTDLSLNAKLSVGSDASFVSNVFLGKTLNYARQNIAAGGPSATPLAISATTSLLELNGADTTNYFTLAAGTYNGQALQCVSITAGSQGLYLNATMKINGSTCSQVRFSAIQQSISLVWNTTVNAWIVVGWQGVNFSGAALNFGTYTTGDINFSAASRLYLSSGVLQVAQNSLLDGNLFVGKDVSLSGKLYSTGDTTANANLFIGRDLSLSGNLYAANKATVINDVSLGSKLFVLGDVSLSTKLFVTGDTTANANLLVTRDLSCVGNLFITGPIYGANKATIINDVSLGSKLFVLGDASLGTKLFVAGDTTANANLFIGRDLSLSGNLYVANKARVINDVSLGSKLFVLGDVSLSTKLFVTGDTTANANLFIGRDLSLSGNLYVANKARVINDVSLGSKLFVLGDVSLSTKLFVTGDTTANANLLVSRDLSCVGNLFITGPIYGANKATVINDVSLGSKLFVLGDASLSTKLFVTGDTTANANLFVSRDLSLSGNLYAANKAAIINDVSLGSKLFVLGDVSLSTKLFVIGDTTANANLSVGGNIFIKGPIYASNDASFSTKLFVAGDVSMNANLSVGNDISCVGNLFVSGPMFSSNKLFVSKDVSLGSNLFVLNDVSFNDRLFVASDATMNANLFISRDLSLSGNLYVANKAAIINDVSLGSKLFVLSDVSLSKKLFVIGDTTANANLFVTRDLSLSGNLYVSNKARLINDVSLGSKLFVVSDVSLSTKLFVTGDTTANANLFIGRDLSLSGNLYVANKTRVINDVSLGSKLFVVGDVSLSTKLFVTGDTTANANLFVSRDLSLSGNLYTANKATIINDVSLGSKLFVIGDASFSSKLFVEDDVSLGSRLFVPSDVSLGSQLFVAGDVSLGSRLFVPSDVSLGSQLFVAGDVSFNSNLYVKGNTIVTGPTILNGTMYSSMDASFGTSIYVTTDISLSSGTAYLRKLNVPMDASFIGITQHIGNVGIGRANPAVALDISCAGSSLSAPLTGTNHHIRMTSTASGLQYSMAMGVDTTGLGGIGYINTSGGAVKSLSLQTLGGNVAVGNAIASGRLHVYEPIGTAAAVNGRGTLVLEHADSGGVSSLVFPSAVAKTTEYGYIQYKDRTGAALSEYVYDLSSTAIYNTIVNQGILGGAPIYVSTGEQGMIIGGNTNPSLASNNKAPYSLRFKQTNTTYSSAGYTDNVAYFTQSITKNSDSFSFMGWIYPTTVSGANCIYYICDVSGAASLFINGDNSKVYFCLNGDKINCLTSTSALTANTWYFVAASYSGTGATGAFLIVNSNNGTAVNSGFSGKAELNSYNIFAIGARNGYPTGANDASIGQKGLNGYINYFVLNRFAISTIDVGSFYNFSQNNAALMVGIERDTSGVNMDNIVLWSGAGTGRVGVNTMAPQQSFHVNGNSCINGSLAVGQTGAGLYYAVDVSGNINLSGSIYQNGVLFSGGGGGGGSNSGNLYVANDISFGGNLYGNGVAVPLGKLHLYEGNGKAASATTGTIVLEHGDLGGASSIVFRSVGDNSGNEYGYMQYRDRGLMPMSKYAYDLSAGTLGVITTGSTIANRGTSAGSLTTSSVNSPTDCSLAWFTNPDSNPLLPTTVLQFGQSNLTTSSTANIAYLSQSMVKKSNTLSFSLWIRPYTVLVGSCIFSVFGLYNSGVSVVELVINSNNLYLYTNNNRTSNYIYYTTTLNINTWYHVAYVFSGTGNGTLYINGVSSGIASGTPVTTLNSYNSLFIGARAGYTTGTVDTSVYQKGFHGLMTGITFNDYALSAAEVLTLYNNKPANAVLTLGIENDVNGIGQDSIVLWPDSGNGYVGVNNIQPLYPLDVSGTLNVNGMIQSNNNITTTGEIYYADINGNNVVKIGTTGMSTGKYGMWMKWNGTGISTDYGQIQSEHQGVAYRMLVLNPQGGSVAINKTTAATALDVAGTVTATAFNATSDYRIKTDLLPIYEGVDKLNPVSFYNTDLGKRDIGFIAHEVQTVFPELVSGEKDGEQMQTLNYIGLIGVLTKEIKDLKQELNTTKQELNYLVTKLSDKGVI